MGPGSGEEQHTQVRLNASAHRTARRTPLLLTILHSDKTINDALRAHLCMTGNNELDISTL